MTQYPSMYRNVLAETNQNLHQNPMMNHPSFGQTMQQKPMGPYPHQQAGMYGPHQQPQPATNPCTSLPYAQFGPNYPSPILAGYPPQIIPDQTRTYVGHSAGAAPIFILPNGIACTNTYPTLPTATCVPYPVTLPVYRSAGNEGECTCGANRARRSLTDMFEKWQLNTAGTSSGANMNSSFSTDHLCKEGNDGAICSQKNCPLSIQLQAIISQLLSIQGIIPSAVTRILLKHIPSSNICESVDEIMERASRYIRQLSKDELLRESRTTHQINGLLGLYLSAPSTPTRLIPYITEAQLKSNVLKAQIESLVNARLMEDQGCGAQAPEALDTLILQLKSDAEIRQLLASLRERECEERVNVSFAAYAPQRQVASSRLANVQAKIRQVEKEIERRRIERCYTTLERSDASILETTPLIDYESPDPFATGISPRKLFLRPHVGSPETTYDKTCDGGNNCSESIVQKDDCALFS